MYINQNNKLKMIPDPFDEEFRNEGNTPYIYEKQEWRESHPCSIYNMHSEKSQSEKEGVQADK